MAFYVDPPARVGHQIAKVSEEARIAISLLGIVVATIAVTATGGGAVAVVVAIGTWGGAGMSLGNVLDKYVLPPERHPDHLIGTGIDSVRLGWGIYPAA